MTFSDGASADPAIHELYRTYADAFARFDAEAIVAHWAFPAFSCARGHRAAMEEDAFRANLDALIAFYRRQGVADVKATVRRVQTLFAGLDLVTVRYCLADATGQPVAEWEHLYLVSDTGEGRRLVAAFSDGELDAWQARGTPLGGR